MYYRQLQRSLYLWKKPVLCLISPVTLYIIQWQKKYKDKGTLSLECKPKGRPKSMNFKRAKKKTNKPLTREEELLLEIESLRCENALLKKFNALVQAEEIKNIKRKP